MFYPAYKAMSLLLNNNAPYFEEAAPAEFWNWLQREHPGHLELPIDIELLNDYAGFTPEKVDFAPLNTTSTAFPVIGCTSITVDNNDVPIDIKIGISNSISEAHKRWTLAHMYAHFFLGHWNDSVNNAESNGRPARELTMFETTNTIDVNNKDPMESECNKYAMELLLPDELFKMMLYQMPVVEIAYAGVGVPYEALSEKAKSHGVKLCAQHGPDFFPKFKSFFNTSLAL